MDEIRKLDCILNKKDRNIVPNDVKVALIGVAVILSTWALSPTLHLQPGRKTMDITRCIRATPRTGYGREANKGRSLFASRAEKRSRGNVAVVAVACKGSIGTSTPGMDSTLGDLHQAVSTTASFCSRGTYSFVIKMSDLLAKDKVFQQAWATLSGFEALLILKRAADI